MRTFQQMSSTLNMLKGQTCPMAKIRKTVLHILILNHHRIHGWKLLQLFNKDYTYSWWPQPVKQLNNSGLTEELNICFNTYNARILRGHSMIYIYFMQIH